MTANYIDYFIAVNTLYKLHGAKPVVLACNKMRLYANLMFNTKGKLL